MPTPKWLLSDSDKKKKMSKAQEKRTAKGYNKTLARVTIGSGNKFEKGDVNVWGEKMIECKVTEGKQITIKLEWLEKLIVEAYREGKEPIFQFGFLGLEKYGKVDWQAVPKDRMEELMAIEKLYYDSLKNK